MLSTNIRLIALLVAVCILECLNIAAGQLHLPMQAVGIGDLIAALVALVGVLVKDSSSRS